MSPSPRVTTRGLILICNLTQDFVFLTLNSRLAGTDFFARRIGHYKPASGRWAVDSG